jgi:LCP family protein required for cell wall assembly
MCYSALLVVVLYFIIFYFTRLRKHFLVFLIMGVYYLSVKEFIVMNNKLKRAIIIIAVILAVLIIAAVALAYILLDRLSSPTDALNDTQDEAYVDESTPDPLVTEGEDVDDNVAQSTLTPEEQKEIEENNKKANVVNILLFGVDRRGTGGNSRTDTIILATLDKNNNRLKLTSILRDLYVEVPGYGSTRINSAGSYGGIELAMQTINTNFSLNVENYVLVDFRMFEKVVNELGGVSVYMTDSEVSAANDCIAGLNKERGATTQEEIWRGFISHGAGTKKLTGKQALGYSRIRHMGSGDFDRVTRQYKILQAIYDTFFKKSLTEQYSILYDIFPLVETNLSKTQIVDLAVSALGLKQNKILNYRIPSAGTYQSKSIKGMAVLVPDLPANVLKLHDFIYNATEQPDETSDTSTGGTYNPPVVSPSPSASPSASPGIEATPTPDPISSPTDSGGGMGPIQMG